MEEGESTSHHQKIRNLFRAEQGKKYVMACEKELTLEIYYLGSKKSDYRHKRVTV